MKPHVRTCTCREGTVYWFPWMNERPTSRSHLFPKDGHSHKGCRVLHVGKVCGLKPDQGDLFGDMQKPRHDRCGP